MEDAKNIILITPLQIMNILKQGKKKKFCWVEGSPKVAKVRSL